jgi:hypothetical protein
MTTCQADRIETLALGLLSPSEARGTQEHLSSCSACRKTFAAFLEERSWFVERQAREETPIRSLRAAVERRLETRRKDQVRPSWTWVATSAAFLVLALLTDRVRLPHRPDPAYVSQPCGNAADTVCESREVWHDGPIASAENRFGACLIATPRVAPLDANFCL